MKKFLNSVKPIVIEQINGANGRSYAGPGFNYPSVTTVTGLHTAEGIKAWRKRVGEAEANRISLKASNRGTKIHTLCESYLKDGSDMEPGLVTENNREMFNAIRPHLDKIDNIHCLETKMVSHNLEVAGTVDCIAEYNQGPIEVIDFKTSNKPKEKQWVDHYFMQTAAYACMFYEATDIVVDRLRLIIGVDGGICQIFEENMIPWLKKFRELRERFRSVKGY